jgi:GNAT superfamily N-acetyltransferase
MIRKLSISDYDSVLKVINDSAHAYKGVIPKDRWKEPYMTAEELKREFEDRVVFYGWIKNGSLVGVMGIQDLCEITLIRHSYIQKKYQRQGLGGKLLKHLIKIAKTSVILVGTWEDANWAIRFYKKNGFKLIKQEEKNILLRKYWNIPERQIETSVVLKLKKIR